MLVGIIKNLDKTYEYLFLKDNTFVSLHVSVDGFSKSNTHYINSIFSKFKLNNDCGYLTKFREYDVYYNSITGLKHFLLSGKEDYDMLFKYNGKDAILYKKEDEFDSFFKRFMIAGLTVSLTLTGFTFIAKTNFNVNTNLSAYISHNISDVVGMKNYEPIDYKDAIDYINSSNFPNELKQVAANEDLLKLVFSYYKGSALEYTARLKFDNLRIEYFGSENPNYYSIDGYYNSSEPNVINICNSDSPYKTHDSMHEFIHLLQAEGTNYYYLNEGVAELMSSELLGYGSYKYFSVVNNLKLLINIVGPEVIYELSFGGDDNRLNEILNTHLSTKDVLTLKHCLATSGLESGEDAEVHKEIETILYKLYKNMYGHDISENKDIMSCVTSHDFGIRTSVFDSRKFLIPPKMNDVEFIELKEANNIMLAMLAKSGVIDKKIGYKEYIKVENPTYDMILNSKEYELVENYNDNQYIRGKVVRSEDEIYYIHFDSLIKIENYNKYTKEYIPSKVYTIQEAIENGFVSVCKVIYSDEKTNDNQIEHTYYVSNDDSAVLTENECKIPINGIKTRFNDQYENLMSRINEESYHK